MQKILFNLKHLLFEESKNDPIKKADTVRDIVNSISKIPDRIKKKFIFKNVLELWILVKKFFLVHWLKLIKKNFKKRIKI